MMDLGPEDFLTGDEREALIKVILVYDKVFAFDRTEKGTLSPLYADPYQIKTVPHTPWVARGIPLPRAKMDEIRAIYQEQLRSGDLEPSDSPYVTAHFFVQKKSGKLRKVVDMSPLNKVTIRDSNVPPVLNEFTEQLAGRWCYGSMDAYSFFDQIVLARESRPLTAIRTPYGLLQSTRLPQGATNSPAYAQRVSDHVFRDEIPEHAGVFVDDLVAKGPRTDYDGELYPGTRLRRCFVEYLRVLCRCLRRYEHAGLTVSGEKFIAITPRLKMTGIEIDRQGKHADPVKVDRLSHWPNPPPNTSSLRGFLGLANYLRPFIPRFAEIDAPLRKLTTGRFRWNEEATKAMDKLKRAAARMPILTSIDYSNGEELVLAVDSSKIAVGWVLYQKDPSRADGRRLILYGSEGFNDVQQRYGQSKLELCGVYKAIKHLRHTVYGTRFILEVDAASIREMVNAPDIPNAAMTRWIAYLKLFDVEIVHVPGKNHVLPDGLSRTEFEGEKADEEWPEEKVGLGVRTHHQAWSGRERIGETDDETVTDDSDKTKGPGHFDEARYQGKWRELGRFLASGCQHKTLADSDIARRRWIKRQLGKYYVQDGRLFKRKEGGPVLVVDTKQEQDRLLHEAHEEHGHRGRDAVFALLSQRVWWERLPLDCAEHVRTCEQCQKRQQGTTREEARHAPVPPLFSQFHMDLVDLGPEVGIQRYLVVAREAFTAWPEARLLSDKTSQSVKSFLEEDVMSRYGAMIDTVLTDNGSENAGEVARLLRRLNIKHAHSTPYNPEGNALSERGHATLIEGLLKAAHDDRRNTARYLPSVLWADRITTRRTTGYSPYELVYGMRPILPMDLDFRTYLLVDWTRITSTSSLLAARARQLLRRDDDLHLAKLRLEYNRSQGRAHFDERNAHRLRQPLQPGTLVLMINPARDSKRQDQWMGPYCVVSQAEGGSYHLSELDGTLLSRTVAAKHLKQYYLRARPCEGSGTMRRSNTLRDENGHGHARNAEPEGPAPAFNLEQGAHGIRFPDIGIPQMRAPTYEVAPPLPQPSRGMVPMSTQRPNDPRPGLHDPGRASDQHGWGMMW